MASMVFGVPASEAKTNDNSNLSNSNEIQQTRGRSIYRQRRYNRRYSNNNRRTRITYRSTLVRVGRSLYRYTYRYTYFPNGRVTKTLYRRTRVR